MNEMFCILPYYKGYPITKYYPELFLKALDGEFVRELGKPSSEILKDKIQSPPAFVQPRPLLEELDPPSNARDLITKVKKLSGIHELGTTGVKIAIYGGGF